MGERAKLYFDEAERLAGAMGKMRLAALAQLTSTEAKGVEDSTDVMARLERAVKLVREEALAARRRNSDHAALADGVIAPPAAETEGERTLRRHVSIYVELTTQRALFLGDVASTARRVTEAAASALKVERVSVWWLDALHTKITCADLFERTKETHSSGMELLAADYAPYFGALRTARTIAAHDANKDSRTACFSAGYLRPLGIESMLDVPIRANDKMVGVICHEHVGPMRTWTGDDESFAYLMSNFLALALERSAAVPLPR